MTRPQPDPIQALREIAPEWAMWLCITPAAIAYWQEYRGDGDCWGIESGREEYWMIDLPSAGSSAIDLTTGTVHLQSADGTITEVTRAEWEKIRD